MAGRTRKLTPVTMGRSDASASRPAAGPSAPSDPADHIRLTADRILVRVPDENERRSKGGLVIPATAVPHNKRCVWSEVALTGPEVRNVRTGDQVLFISQTGLEVDIRGEVFLLLRERDVQAVASDRTDVHGGGQYL
jgi:chaperonin GroES